MLFPGCQFARDWADGLDAQSSGMASSNRSAQGGPWGTNMAGDVYTVVLYEKQWKVRFAGKHSGNRVLMTLLAPGLWLQRLTTREPSLEQIEVSIRALREVLSLESRSGESRVEVMA